MKETGNPYRFSGRGGVYSWTIIYDPPVGFERFAPYTIALIKLDEGPIVTAQLTDLDPNSPINIGDKVEMVTRILKFEGNPDSGLIIYGYKFRPIL